MRQTHLSLTSLTPLYKRGGLRHGSDTETETSAVSLGVPLAPTCPAAATRSPQRAVRGPCGHHRGAPSQATVLEGSRRQRVGQPERLPPTQRVARW